MGEGDELSLPQGYTQLDYIQSTGTQYIDTGFKPNQNTSFEIEYEKLAVDTTAICYWGARNTTSLRYEVMNGSTNPKGQVYYGSKSNSTLNMFAVGRHTFRQEKRVATCDGTSVTLAANTFQINYNFGLFTIQNAGKWDTRIPTMRLYTAKLWDNGTLIRDYIPCINASGEIGLYDAVNNNFAGNSGTGVFIAGIAVPQNLRAVSVSGATITIAWDAVPCDGYRLYRDDSLIATLTETSYTDEGLMPNKSYTYSVLAYNEYGESAAISVEVKTGMPGSIDELHLITDRAAEDVAQKNAKGRYTADDLNRVGMAMDYVRDRLSEAGYSVTVSPKTDWTRNDAPTSGQLVQYLTDMRKLRDKMRIETALPENMRKLTYQQANDIEQILLNIDGLLNNIAAAYIYSGEIFSGEA